MSIVVKLPHSFGPSSFGSRKLYLCKDINNYVGDLFGTVLFLALICLLNSAAFDPKSFCLMNPREALCRQYRDELNCKRQHEFNLTTGLGFHYDEYAGMFQTHRTGRVFIPYFE